MKDMIIMTMSSPDHNSRSEAILEKPITASTFPGWKLYGNPFYNPHVPLLARKPIMESELEFTRAQIMDLTTELEYERKARKNAESMNKRLAKELAEERRVFEEHARDLLLDKVVIDRMKKEIKEERKMLRMAQVLREERVQMKLAEAKIFFEEKLLELEGFKGTINSCVSDYSMGSARPVISSKKPARDNSNNDNICVSSSAGIQRKASPERENPHIKRGIKGFVEFPKVVRAMGSKRSPRSEKLECQRAQLRILLKQKSPIRSNNLFIS